MDDAARMAAVTPFDPFALPRWTATADLAGRDLRTGAATPPSLERAFQRAFSVANILASLRGVPTSGDAALALRESLVHVALNVEGRTQSGIRCAAFVAQDSAQSVAIAIDVLDVPRVAPSEAVSSNGRTAESTSLMTRRALLLQRESLGLPPAEGAEAELATLDAATAAEEDVRAPGPLLPVRYLVGSRSRAMDLASSVAAARRDGACNREGVMFNMAVEIKCNLDELALFEKMLADNALRVSSAAAAAFRASPESVGGKYTLSYVAVLPPAAETLAVPQGIGTATCRASGCGADAPLKCAGCAGATYCSAKCQRADWPTH